jgi:hypothetical protein
MAPDLRWKLPPDVDQFLGTLRTGTAKFLSIKTTDCFLEEKFKVNTCRKRKIWTIPVRGKCCL